MPASLSTRNLRSKFIRIAWLLTVAFVATSKVFSQSTDIKAELKQRFKDKTFLIQGWYQDDDLTYDSSGVVVGTPQRGFWAESAVKIHSIKVRRKEKDIVLRGHRGGFAYDSKTKRFAPLIANKREMTITIQADPATLTPANLDTLEHAIFAQSPRLDGIPEYWRDFMVRGEQDAKKDARGATTQGDVVAAVQSNGHPVFRIGSGVTAPRALKHDEPGFTEVARQTRSQGTVVLSIVINDQGVPTQIKIKKALGMGLDDAAVNSVEQWRFAPAKLNDKPVAVLVDIEVSFKLY